MINDPYRLVKYHQYFEKNAKGKVILDVGAGLGLIGLKALEYGAAHVYLVEQEPYTANVLKKIVSELPNAHQVTIIDQDFHGLNRGHFHQEPDLLVCELWGPHLWNEGIHATHMKAQQLFPKIDFYPYTYKSDFNIVQIPFTEHSIWPRKQLENVDLTEIYKQEYLGFLLDRYGVKHVDLTAPAECFSLNGAELKRTYEILIEQDYKDVFFNMSHHIQWEDHVQKWRHTYFYVPEIKANTKLKVVLDDVYLPVFSYE